MKEETLKQLIPAEEQYKLEARIAKGKTPLWEHWEEFVTHYLREGKSEVTINSVRSILRSIIRNLKIQTIEDCNNPTFLREALYQAKEQRNWANTTLNSHRKNINTYFLWLEDMEYIDENKIKKIRKCKEDYPEQYTLDDEKLEKLRLQLSTRRQTRLERWRNVLFFEIMSFTGARPCEMLQIQCRDLKKDKNHTYKLVIKGRKQKGRKRYYRLPTYIRDTLEIYYSVRQDLNREEELLFVSHSKRTGWTGKGLQKLCQRLSQELGFRVNSYAIRRFVATKLNEKHQSLEHIAEYLGHTRTSTTKRYIERSCILTDECSETMGNILGRSNSTGFKFIPTNEKSSPDEPFEL